jgi:hypothetical protein
MLTYRDCTERDKMATLLDDGLLEDGIGGHSVDGQGGASPDAVARRMLTYADVC